VITIQRHQRDHGIVYTDLLELHRRKLIKRQKTGRQWVFTPAPNLEEAPMPRVEPGFAPPPVVSPTNVARRRACRSYASSSPPEKV
jgi:hypothetical protein